MYIDAKFIPGLVLLFVMIAGASLVWIHMLTRAYNLTEVERGKKLIVAIRLGGRIGGLGISDTLREIVDLRCYDTFLVINTNMRSIVLTYDEIDNIIHDKVWAYLQIEHHNPNAPKDIKLSGLNNARVKNILDELVKADRHQAVDGGGRNST